MELEAILARSYDEIEERDEALLDLYKVVNVLNQKANQYMKVLALNQSE